ncbi:hypothetical protein GQX74_004520 [Glossina fuscipes]|nr:hypothetical protein GQX74_004520 [Glossina fuscipes]
MLNHVKKQAGEQMFAVSDDNKVYRHRMVELKYQRTLLPHLQPLFRDSYVFEALTPRIPFVSNKSQ